MVLLQGTLDVHEIELRGSALQHIAQRGGVRGWLWVSVSSRGCGTVRAFPLSKGEPTTCVGFGSAWRAGTQIEASVGEVALSFEGAGYKHAASNYPGLISRQTCQ